MNASIGLLPDCFTFGNSRLANRLKGPVLSRCRGPVLGDLDRCIARIRRHEFDPAHKMSDRLGRQLRLLRRHFETFVPQCLYEQTVGRFAGNNRRAAVAAAADPFAMIEPQASFDGRCFRAMTLVAVLLQRWFDLLPKQFQPRCVVGFLRAHQRREYQNQQ